MLLSGQAGWRECVRSSSFSHLARDSSLSYARLRSAVKCLTPKVCPRQHSPTPCFSPDRLLFANLSLESWGAAWDDHRQLANNLGERRRDAAEVEPKNRRCSLKFVFLDPGFNGFPHLAQPSLEEMISSLNADQFFRFGKSVDQRFQFSRRPERIARSTD